MTLLQHVKLRPVLPALKLIKMSRTLGSVLMMCSASDRLSFLIAPSTIVSGTENVIATSTLTSHEFNAFRPEERLDKIQEARELREYYRLFLLTASALDIKDDLK